MANRQELGIIRGARSGEADSQLELGKRYLFGSAGLPQSAPTALYWLARAAQQGCAEAWLLIGAHIPFEAAQQGMPAPHQWYERAYDAGQAQAGLVFAQLVLASDPAEMAPLRDKALRALETAALAGLPDAQWLLAQQSGADAVSGPESGSAAELAAVALPQSDSGSWLTQAADNGVAAASYMLTEQAWEEGDWAAFLQRALPIARVLAGDYEVGASEHKQTQFAPQEVLLLSRCIQALGNPALGNPALLHDADHAEIDRFGELAAAGGDRAAQLALGLHLARMDGQGARMQARMGSANFKRAIRWLTQAGEQGLAEAWFALSRIYVKPEFSQRSVLQAQSYLERAADMGHSAAQLECGIHAWRTRRDGDNHDVRAAYWLLKAASQGCPEAEAALRKIAPAAGPVQWAGPLDAQALQELGYSQPFLAARLELAACFKLSRAEALLLDINAADRGHCLLVDITASYGRSKRRLVLLRTTRERRVLDRIVGLFEGVDCGPTGPEGNYRQRLYRLKTCLSHMWPEAGPEPGLLLA